MVLAAGMLAFGITKPTAAGAHTNDHRFASAVATFWAGPTSMRSKGNALRSVARSPIAVDSI
jgi:hypothetical protein